METIPTLMRKSFHWNLKPRLSILLPFALVKTIFNLFIKTSNWASATKTAPESVCEKTVKGYSVSWKTWIWLADRIWFGVLVGSCCVIKKSDGETVRTRITIRKCI